MQTVSSIYLEGMGEMVRRPSRMRLTFHYPTGDIIYTNRDIVKVTEKKTAHLIAGELPAVELEMELTNLDGSFNPNDISGLHDLIVKGVPVTYEFGYDIPNLQYYGYTDDGEEHDYGMDENVPYGFMEGYATEWIPGGEVVTSGEISYSKTTATISAKDHLSFLDEHVLFAYGNSTLAQVAKAVLNLTDYPKEDDGDPKIITGPELDAFSTAITLSETEDDSISAKEHLQTIAHACGVQMYIDRAGYIHLDNDKRGVGAVYSLPLGQQGETPEHRKEQMPKKVVITLNSEYGDPVETDLNGGGETMTVENPFIVTTAEGETLRDIVYDHFIKYRNTADIPYRGEPALDILDTITLGTEFGGDVEAIVVGTELQFDGTLSGSLSVRYQLGGNTPEKVQIKGSGNFIYPLGVDDEPSTTSFNLLCETTFDTPTYQWSYFTVSNGSWLNIAGATSNTLTVAYNSLYYNNDSSVKFRCVVNGIKGAIAQISKIQLQKSETAGYRGVQKKATKEEIDVPSPQIGDVVLLDNTDNEDAGIYGEAHVYDGEKWVSTENSDALAMTYKDALQLAKDSGKKIYASEIYADLIVTKNLKVGESGGIPNALSFDGVNDYCTIPAMTNLATLTVEMKVYFNALTDSWLINKRDNASDNQWQLIYVGGMLSVDLFGGSTTPVASIPYEPLYANRWYSLAFTTSGVSGSTAYLFVDGVGVNSAVLSGNMKLGSLGITIGARSWDYSRGNHNGKIKDVRIWDIVRSGVEILANKDAVFTGSETGLIAYYKMDEGTGLIAYDSAGSNDGTIYGATWIIDQATGFDFHALTDDGTGKPRFGAYYDGRPLLVVDPPTGRVFFGEHFWYDPATGSIRTPNDKTVIKADGTIEAVDGRFTGDIIANSGLFKGIFDTTVLRLEPGGANVLSKYVGDNYNQALDLYDYFVTSQGLSEDTYYRIKSPTSGTYTFSSEYPPLDFSKVKYVRFMRDHVFRHVIFYDSTFTLLGRVRKRVDGSTTAQLKLNASITLAVAYGGDKLIVSSDIPINTYGLDDYQVYLSGDTLKVKLP